MLHLLGVEQEKLAAAAAPSPLPLFSDVVFQCTFDGVNGATTAIDESVVNAPLTFHGGAHISNAAPNAAVVGFNALQCTAAVDCVSAPHNALYDSLCDADFTIQFWWRIITFPARPIQWVGVWDDSQPGSRVWRVISDISNIMFQWMQNGQVHTYRIISDNITWINGRWEHPIISRFGNTVRIFNGSEASGCAYYSSFTLTGPLDTPSVNVPLRIGGDGSLDGANGTAMMMRLTKGSYDVLRVNTFLLPNSWHSPSAAFGQLKPSLIAADDVFRAPRVANANVIVPRVIDQETFYSPTLNQGIGGGGPTFTIAHTNNAQFPVRERLPNGFPVDDIFYGTRNFDQFGNSIAVTPGFPEVKADGDGDRHPVFLDATVTTGSGTSATLDLPPTRDLSDFLFAVIQLKTPVSGRVFDLVNHREFGTVEEPMPSGVFQNLFTGDVFEFTIVAGGGRWYLDDGLQFVYGSFTGTKAQCGIATWGFIFVDGAETQPTFTWDGGGSDWVGTIFRFRDVDPIFISPLTQYTEYCGNGTAAGNAFSDAGPLSGPMFSQGASSSADGEWMHSLFWGAYVVNNANVLPVPAHYNSGFQFNSAAGSILMFYRIAPAGSDVTSGNVRITLSEPAGTWTNFFLTMISDGGYKYIGPPVP